MEAAAEVNGVAGVGQVAHRSEPQRLSREEVLEVENRYLRMQNLRLQVQALDHQIEGLVQQKNDLAVQLAESRKDFDAFREQLSVKYGTRIEQGTVQPDGTIGLPQAKVSP